MSHGAVKKVCHKSEEKMHNKIKMTSQRAENLVHVRQRHGKYFIKKMPLIMLKMANEFFSNYPIYQADIAIFLIIRYWSVI